MGVKTSGSRRQLLDASLVAKKSFTVRGLHFQTMSPAKLTSRSPAVMKRKFSLDRSETLNQRSKLARDMKKNASPSTRERDALRNDDIHIYESPAQHRKGAAERSSRLHQS